MKALKTILFAAVLCCVAALLFHRPLLRLAYDFLVIEGHQGKADAIVVFCGGGGERIAYGIELLGEGYAGRILFCGTDPEATFVQSILAGRGLRVGDNVEIEGGFIGTYESMKYVKEWAHRNGIRSFLAVSSPTHMRRIKMLANRLFGPGPPRVILCPTRGEEYGGPWWENAFTRRAVIKEWKKLLYSWFKYWN